MIDPIAGLQAEYTSAVECRVRLGLAFIDASTRGDQRERERIYPALEEARGAEEQCRLALRRAVAESLAALEEAA
jgi:hypothetical protein